MNAVVSTPDLPAPVARRGISESQWRTLVNNLYPGAASESVIMVWDYCAARKLDPLKKPCHIVPMRVRDAKTGEDVWRDVVMPGIYEYRTTAQRTGEYMGHSKPEYGEPVEFLGATVPEWCEMTIYRWNFAAKQRVEYPVRVYFRECAGTRKDKNQGGKQVLNQRWATAPIQMMTKVCEAAGLREAFPDEFGGEQTFEEMDGRVIEHEPTTPLQHDPRGDVSSVDFELRDKHVSAITDILAQDKDEYGIADDLRAYEQEHLARFNELYITVQDRLAKDKIISKANWRKYLDTRRPA
jgi:phage recombination protein Bet